MSLRLSLSFCVSVCWSGFMSHASQRRQAEFHILSHRLTWITFRLFLHLVFQVRSLTPARSCDIPHLFSMWYSTPIHLVIFHTYSACDIQHPFILWYSTPIRLMIFHTHSSCDFPHPFSFWYPFILSNLVNLWKSSLTSNELTIINLIVCWNPTHRATGPHARPLARLVFYPPRTASSFALLPAPNCSLVCSFIRPELLARLPFYPPGLLAHLLFYPPLTARSFSVIQILNAASRWNAVYQIKIIAADFFSCHFDHQLISLLFVISFLKLD